MTESIACRLLSFCGCKETESVSHDILIKNMAMRGYFILVIV